MFETIKDKLIFLFAFQFLINTFNETCIGFKRNIQMNYKACEADRNDERSLVQKERRILHNIVITIKAAQQEECHGGINQQKHQDLMSKVERETIGQNSDAEHHLGGLRDQQG